MTASVAYMKIMCKIYSDHYLDCKTKKNFGILFHTEHAIHNSSKRNQNVPFDFGAPVPLLQSYEL